MLMQYSYVNCLHLCDTLSSNICTVNVQSELDSHGFGLTLGLRLAHSLPVDNI